ncbi:MAG: translation initiation factor IF-2 [Candidatus Micrarchaeia archaeon]
MLRCPIVVTLGHIDHGKTTLLDKIRKTTIALKEPGAITQSIGASEVPIEVIKKICKPVEKIFKVEFKIPGLLFIDTPGHESFTNLRKRGGSIADIAILVVDLTQGVQKQTEECIEILKSYKTPFVIAANKIDLITGWKKSEGSCFLESFQKQRDETKRILDEKIYELIGEISKFGFQSERFDRITDFTKYVCIIPVSSKTGEGIPELISIIAGLSQKYLASQLKSEIGPGKGSILEVKFERGLGNTIDVILYDGEIKVGDKFVFCTRNGVMSTRVRGILKKKLDKYENVEKSVAASGIKILADNLEGALPGSEIFVVRNEGEEAEKISFLSKEISEIFSIKEEIGVILKCDTLGSLEAIEKLLESEKIPLRRADIGQVNKSDVLEALSIKEKNRYYGVILSFNVGISEDAAEEAERKNLRIINTNVIYSLIDQYFSFVEEEKKRAEEEAIQKFTLPGKIRVLPGFFFRMSKPAIFGVEVLVGKIRPGYKLIDENGNLIGEIKSIQSEKKSLDLAKVGEKVAIAVDEGIINKNIFENQILYNLIPKKDIEILLEKYKNQLSQDEISVINEIKKLMKK